ncbi:tetratricopeptide repeat protein [Schaalia sp. ZJ1691]|uniref:tetratricopeptide repeat protein n=1 Tax=Schaalia sp. ZJ1691 TaxID=2709404 RepID=UPI0013EA7673|nr:tetratricopeptide repeat protein [Schaalia sp. ZJ1691]
MMKPCTTVKPRTTSPLTVMDLPLVAVPSRGGDGGQSEEELCTPAELIEEAIETATQGDYEKAVSQAERAVIHPATNSQDTLAILRLLITWNGQMDRPNVALAWATIGSIHSTLVKGADSHETLTMRNATLYWACMCGYSNLDSQFNELRQDVRRVCGDNDPLVWAVENNSAMPSKLSGDWERAIEIYRNLREDMSVRCEKSDVLYLAVRDNFAEALGEAERFDEAIEEYSALLTILTDCFGADDHRTLRVRHCLARMTYLSGNSWGAENLWNDLADRFEETFGPSDPRTVTQMVIQMTFAMDHQEWDQAALWCQKILAVAPQEWDEDERALFHDVMADIEQKISQRRLSA